MAFDCPPFSRFFTYSVPCFTYKRFLNFWIVGNFDKSNILFLRFEDLSNQTQVLKECKGFLNLKHDMVHTGDINIHENPTRTHSMELDSGLLYDLKKLFALKNNNLSDLIGLDLDR